MKGASTFISTDYQHAIVRLVGWTGQLHSSRGTQPTGRDASVPVRVEVPEPLDTRRRTTTLGVRHGIG